jgi:hypothetical protein
MPAPGRTATPSALLDFEHRQRAFEMPCSSLGQVIDLLTFGGWHLWH